MRLFTALGAFAFLSRPASAQLPENGPDLYRIGCAQCHGADGRGADPSTLGFTTPLPDFADCRFASREASDDWIAVTHLGGPARGFASTMPAYAEAFDPERIGKIVEFMRGFCTDESWPRGELNLPLPLVTEKAFPEDEVLWTTFVDAEGKGAVATEFVYEKRVGARHQWELALPIGLSPSSEGEPWLGGIGDVKLGWKSAFWHTPDAILTAGGEVVLPTGDEDRGLGIGTTVFEPYLSFARALPGEWYIQGQGGAEIPADTEAAESELFFRAAIGTSFAATGGYGRMWSPMIEILASAPTGFEETSWSVLPQMQVTLSTRQHVRVSGGVQVPVNRADERPTRFVFYFLWDWFDGGLLDGW
jgi:mono/diheme cytochrome c family protein